MSGAISCMVFILNKTKAFCSFSLFHVISPAVLLTLVFFTWVEFWICVLNSGFLEKELLSMFSMVLMGCLLEFFSEMGFLYLCNFFVFYFLFSLIFDAISRYCIIVSFNNFWVLSLIVLLELCGWFISIVVKFIYWVCCFYGFHHIPLLMSWVFQWCEA